MEKEIEINEELIEKFVEFLKEFYYEELITASNEKKPLVIEFSSIDKFNPDFGDFLLEKPEKFFEVIQKAVDQIELPNPVKVRISKLPETINIRDLRAEHLNKFLYVDGIVRKASEIRPEIEETIWECPECGEKIPVLQEKRFLSRPMKCECGNRKGFKQVEKKLVDTRWIVLEEPFELTEGERPSQLTVLLKEDLVNPELRRVTNPGNRLKITGVLKEIPRGRGLTVKLDFYLEANHIEPAEVGWEHLKITPEDEEEIKKLAKDPDIYEKLVNSLAPS